MAAPLSGTASVGPLIDTAGPGQPFYAPASGGGGGGGGPNPNVSSLNVNVGGNITFINDNSWDNAGIQWNADATGVSSINIQPQYLVNEAGANTGAGLKVLFSYPGGSTATRLGAESIWLQGPGGPPLKGAVLMNDPTDPGSAYISSIRVSSINGVIPGSGGSADPNPVFSTVNVSSSVVAAQLTASSGVNIPARAGEVACGAADESYGSGASLLYISSGVNTAKLSFVNTGLYARGGPLNADNIDVNYNLNVSSINGQAPGGGGGGGPNITASTITLSGPNPITANLSTTQDSFEVRYGGGSGNPLSVLNIDKASPAQAEFGVRVLSTLDGTALARFEMNVVPSTDNTATLSLSTDHTVGSLTFSPAQDSLAISANSTITMSAAGGVGIPVLNNVSTITGPGVYPKVSTISLSSFVNTVWPNLSTNSVQQVSDPFDIQLGHIYQLSFNYTTAPTAPASYGQYASFAIAGPSAAGSRTWNSDLSVSTFNQGQIVIAGNNSGQVYLTATANTTAPVNLDFVYNTTNLELVDFGPIASSF